MVVGSLPYPLVLDGVQGKKSSIFDLFLPFFYALVRW